MNDYGIFVGEQLMMVCGSKEKAEEMLENYPEGKIFPVDRVNGKWVKT